MRQSRGEDSAGGRWRRYRDPVRTMIDGALISLAPAGASAYDRWCHWPGAGVVSVPVQTNINNYLMYGYDPTQVFVNARWVWNSQGGSNLQLTSGGTTTLESAAAGTILFNTDRVHPGAPGAIATADLNNDGAGQCEEMNITFHMNWAHCTGMEEGGPATAGCADMWSVALHELGHTIGFNHSATTAVMNAGYSDQGQRFLYPDDVAGLKCTGGGAPCNGHGYGGRTDATLEYKYSTNRGTSFSDGTDPVNGYTTLPPAVAFGRPGGTDRYVIARVSSSANNGQIYRDYGNGSSAWAGWLGVSGAKSFTGVSLVRGSGYYIMTFPDDTGSRTVKATRSTDGVAWTTPASIGFSTPLRPAMARLPGTDDILMVYVDSQYRLQFWRSLDDGTNWDECVDAICDPSYRNNGWCPQYVTFAPAIACESTSSCIIWWTDGVNPAPHIRERKIWVSIAAAPCVGSVSAEPIIPPVSGRGFLSLHGDLTGTYDAANDDWVLGFRERNGATSALTWWRDADADDFDPYLGSGLVSDGALSSPGIAYTTDAASPRVGIFFSL